ncbi:polyribonucleotide nucleotidyltransferase [Desulfobacterota bacterium AH_259_B03_O07]|nr:polyribonucleotide nucleotidyltransferase [Desulfobacterota bacterium AH_259_B03_O07]
MKSEPKNIKTQIYGKNIELDTGRVAKQANGSVLAKYGDIVVLATVVAAAEKVEGEDFLPLTINYQERSYAAGKIPGGYFKREGRPSEVEILASRLIDRPVRPLIPKEFCYETQIIVTVLSADQDNTPDVVSVTAASAALLVSDVPFEGPIAAVRVGRIEGEFICNPTRTELEKGDVDIVVAGTKEAIVMVEGGAKVVPEGVIIEALMFAHNCIKEFIKIQEDLVDGMNIKKRELPTLEENNDIIEKVSSTAKERLEEAVISSSKIERKEKVQAILQDTQESLSSSFPGMEGEITKAFDSMLKDLVRGLIVKNKKRIDERGYKDIRPISCEVGFLPRTHGSSLFTRGETQAAVTTTLGTAYDEQRIDSLEGDVIKRFMLHYNFPPFSVGEIGGRLGPGRREIGHGALAEKALLPVIPSKDNFPYTLRVVSEILESNGSSSMATVCGASLSLLDAGVPISAPVSGIAMGLIKENEEFVILSDILGDEDHLGDMDFKVAGTEDGITALQMDIKVTGVTKEILTDALNQAHEARLFVLNKMNEVINKPREEISEYAPRILTIQVNPDKIKDVIGPGGKMIKKIIEITGANIDIGDSGIVNISSPNSADCEKAERMIQEIVQDIEVGKVYLGRVKRVLDFGAIVELTHGKDGLVHISQLAPNRVGKVSDIVVEGDELLVKCIGKDNDGRIRLSRKDALEEDIENYRGSFN